MSVTDEQREPKGGTWRERFEAARDMDINRSIHEDRARTYRSEGCTTTDGTDGGRIRWHGGGKVDLPPLIKPRHPVVAFLLRIWRRVAPTDSTGAGQP